MNKIYQYILFITFFIILCESSKIIDNNKVYTIKKLAPNFYSLFSENVWTAKVNYHNVLNLYKTLWCYDYTKQTNEFTNHTDIMLIKESCGDITLENAVRSISLLRINNLEPNDFVNQFSMSETIYECFGMDILMIFEHTFFNDLQKLINPTVLQIINK